MNKLIKAIEEKYISELSDRELIAKYDYIKYEIKIDREIRGFARAEDIEYKNKLSKEMKKRGFVL